MKKTAIIFALIFPLFTFTCLSQNISINQSGSTPDGSAVLDVQPDLSLNMGLLIPRLDNSQRNSISSPATGLFIYNTSNSTLQYWNGTYWMQIVPSDSLLATNPGGINVGNGVAINITGAAPAPSAIFDLQSTTGGLLIPRMNNTQINSIVSPVAGLIAFNTTYNLLNFYTGSAWAGLCAETVSNTTGAVTNTANAAINSIGSAPDPSSILDVASTSQGMAIPRLSSIERNAIYSPAQGLMLYNTTTQTIDVYNGTTNYWVQFATQNTSFCGDSIIYCIGGLDGTFSAVNNNYAYNPVSAIWTSEAPIPAACNLIGIALVGKTIYCIGGADNSGNNLSGNYAYNTVTNTWKTSLAAIPKATQGLCAVAVGNIIYCIGGGYNGSNPYVYTSNYAYNTTTNTWAAKAAIPNATADFGAAAVGNIIYCIGGYNGNGTWFTNNYAYNTTTNAWTTKAAIPIQSAYFCAVTVGNIIYCLGGSNGSGILSANNYAYNTSTDTWAAKAPLPQESFIVAAVAVGSNIYCIGGYNYTNSALNTNYVYSTTSDTWTTATSIPDATYAIGAAAVAP